MSDIVKYIDMRIYECAEQGHDHMALTLKAVQALRAELAEARRVIDEALKQVPVAWSVRDRHGRFVTEQSHRADEYASLGRTIVPLYAAPVPAQPAVPDDVAKDAARYRWMRADGPNTYMTLKETAHLIGDAYDEAIDAAILSAADSEGRKDE